LAAIPALEKLASQEKISVVTAWTDCLVGNEKFHRLYHPNQAYLFDDVIAGNEFIAPEPYQIKEYYNDGIHLAHAFAKCLEVEIDDVTPKIYFDVNELNFAIDLINNIKKERENKPVIMLQAFSATQASCDEVDSSMRGMNKSMIMKLLDGIDGVFINFSRVQIIHEKVLTPNEPSLRLYMALTSMADYCLGIDSCMMHVAAATGRVGTFFWGATNPKQLGYERFQNIQRHGYPKRHQPMRFSNDNRVNAGAMDWTDTEIEQAIEAINAHLGQCLSKADAK
jgi:hypothetical protein